MDKVITLKKIDFDRVASDYEFENSSSISDDDLLTVAMACAQAKDKIIDRVAEGILKWQCFSFLSAYDLKKNIEHATLDDYLKNLEAKGKNFVVANPRFGFSLAANTGLVLEYEENEYDVDQGKRVSKRIHTFASFSTLRAALIRARLSIKNLDEKTSEALTYFTQNAPRIEAYSYWYENFVVEEFKKKSLFGKGSAKVSVIKPQLLLDVEERINNLLKDRGIVVFIVPQTSPYIDVPYYSNVKNSWECPNPEGWSMFNDKYLFREREYILSIRDEKKFYIILNHNYKEDSVLYKDFGKMYSRLIFVGLKE